LLSDALGLKLKEEINSPLIIDTLMEDDLSLDIEVGSLAVSVKMEICGVIDSFIFFLTKYDERVTHNMLSLTLDLIHKSLKSKFSFIGHDKGVYAIYSDKFFA
jgi:hypothetical protein